MTNQKEVEKLVQKAEKTFHFNRSHNIMTSQPEGVMAVSEAEKIFNELKECININDERRYLG